MARTAATTGSDDVPLRAHGRRVAGLLRAVAASPVNLDVAAPLKDLPWVSRLDKHSLRTFLDEYAAAYQTLLDDGNVQMLDTLLKEWEATAEALEDPELRRLLDDAALARGERIPLDYPA